VVFLRQPRETRSFTISLLRGRARGKCSYAGRRAFRLSFQRVSRTRDEMRPRDEMETGFPFTLAAASLRSRKCEPLVSAFARIDCLCPLGKRKETVKRGSFVLSRLGPTGSPPRGGQPFKEERETAPLQGGERRVAEDGIAWKLKKITELRQSSARLSLSLSLACQLLAARSPRGREWAPARGCYAP